jgi:serine/threonine protein kinase
MHSFETDEGLFERIGEPLSGDVEYCGPRVRIFKNDSSDKKYAVQFCSSPEHAAHLVRVFQMLVADREFIQITDSVIALDYIKGDVLTMDMTSILPDAVNCMTSLCNELDMLHGKGLLHRNIHQGNIILGGAGRWSFLGFDSMCRIEDACTVPLYRHEGCLSPQLLSARYSPVAHLSGRPASEVEYSTQDDIFALGKVFLKIVEHLPEHDVMRNFLQHSMCNTAVDARINLSVMSIVLSLYAEHYGCAANSIVLPQPYDREGSISLLRSSFEPCLQDHSGDSMYLFARVFQEILCRDEPFGHARVEQALTVDGFAALKDIIIISRQATADDPDSDFDTSTNKPYEIYLQYVLSGTLAAVDEAFVLEKLSEMGVCEVSPPVLLGVGAQLPAAALPPPLPQPKPCGSASVGRLPAPLVPDYFVNQSGADEGMHLPASSCDGPL